MKDERCILESERVKFVLTEEEHLEKRVAYINDPEIQRTLNIDYPTSLSKTKKWLDSTLMDRSRVDFSILDREIGEMIGFCGLINIQRPVMKAEVYIVIGNKDYWGEGYGREANKMLHNYGFIELGLNRIYGYMFTFNEKIRKNSEALGKKLEAHFRESIYSHGELKDQYMVAILRSEWEDNEAYDI